MAVRRIFVGMVAVVLAVAGVDVVRAGAGVGGKPAPGPSVVAGSHAGSGEVSAADVGNVFDLGGDTAFCQNDLATAQADFSYLRLLLTATTNNPGCVTDPTTWFPGISEVDWYFDYNGDNVEDAAVGLFVDASNHLVAQTFVANSDGTFTRTFCDGTATWNGANSFTANMPASCFLAAPFRFYASFLYDENPSGSTCFCDVDFVPDTNFSGPVPRHEHNRDGDGAGTASAEPGQLDVVIRGLDGVPYARHFDGGSFTGYTPLQGVMRGTPAAVSSGPGVLHVFVRGQDDKLYVAQRSAINGGYTAFAGVGGILTSSPAAVSAAPGTMDVFVAGSDRALYVNHYDGTNFGGWRTLGGIITATPAVTSPSPGVIVVFVRGFDNGLYQLTLTSAGGNSGWSARGGIINAAPAATSVGDGSIDVFVRGQDYALWTLHIVGAGSGGWQSLGGIISGPPAATSSGAGSLDTFIRGFDEALWWNHLAGGNWSGWISLGGTIT